MKKMKNAKAKKLLPLLLLLPALFLFISVHAAGENANFGVEGYTSGSEWNITAVKSLRVNTGKLETNTGGYSVRITLAKGMKLGSYLWNPADPAKWPVGDGVQGTQVPMDNDNNDFFNGGSVSVDPNGNTVLIYKTSDGCSSMILTDKITVQPDENVTYGDDNINNAIKFELLDSSDNVLEDESVNVRIAKDKIRNTSFTEKKFLNGAKNVMLYQVDYFRSGLSSIPSGTVDITLGVPECVDSITRLVDTSANSTGSMIDGSKWNFDANSHILTITGYETQPGKHFKCELYGNISSTAAVKSYSADQSITKFVYTNTYNGGTPTYTQPEGFVNMSKYYVSVVEAQDTIVLNDYNSGIEGYAQSPEGYPSIFGKLRSFFTSNAQEQNQMATWEFDEDTLDVVGVFFPVDQASNITITSVTFNDGTTRNDLSMDFNKYGNQKIRYVNAADIKEKDPSIPAGARFIRSITANCGTFSEGFSSGSWYGKPVGYFSQAVVEAGEKQNLEYRFKVNNAEAQTLSVGYDPDGEFSCLYITSSGFSDEGRTKGATSYKAGETIYMSTRVSVGSNLYVSTAEPRLYVVVPQWMSFDPDKMKAKWWVTTSDTTRPEKDDDYIDDNKIKYTYSYVKNSAGENYTCYEFYVQDSVVGNYLERTGHIPWKGEHATSIVYEYELAIDETAGTQTLNMGDYIMAGKGDLKTGKFLKASGQISNVDKADIWDFDGDTNRSEQDVIIGANDQIVTIMDNTNITVSGYLTHQGLSDAVNPYDPGKDGSNEVNVVEFMPGDYADYHVLIKNTLVSVGERCSVNAYLPIPNGNISGSEFTPTNTNPELTNKWYQFDAYKWPMELRGLIQNADPNIFDIVYYFDRVTLGQNGVPDSSEKKVNPSTLTAEELDRVVLVEIKSKDGITIPSGSVEFNLPLKVGADETQATAAGLNLKKNIFRPRYHREGGIGAVWVDGNYVAARLAVSSIGGNVFDDTNGNSHWDEGEEGINGVTVELYDSTGRKVTEKATATVDGKAGKYSFTSEDNGGVQLPADTYTIKVTNPNRADYVFTKQVPATQANYMTNSEAIAKENNAYAEMEITIPYNGVLSGYQEYQNAGLFIDKVGGGADGNSPDGIPDACQVRVNYAAEKGTIKTGQKTFEYFHKEDGNGGYEKTFNVNIASPPAVTPNAGCVLDSWKNSKDDTTNEDGKFTFANVNGGTEITITAVHEERNYTVSFDANADTTDTVTDIPEMEYKQHGVDLQIPGNIPRRSDMDGKIYTFIGWNTEPDGDGTDYGSGSIYNANEDITLYAQWGVDVNEYHVYHYFESLVGSDSVVTEHGSAQYGDQVTINAKEVPGFSFTYCDKSSLQEHDIVFEPEENDKPQVKITIPGSEAEIHVRYYYNRCKYKIEFDTAGGTAIDPIEGKYESSVNAPEDPTRDGFVFVGWDKEIPETMPAENLKIKALWDEVHTITFKDHDGTVLGTSTGVEGSAITIPSVPERDGYRNTGWDQELPEDGLIPNHGMTLTAQYEPIEYTISYFLNGGTASNPTRYTIESDSITLINPQKAGFSFQGWTGTGLTDATDSVVIPKGSTGNRSYTANWPSTAEYEVEHYKQQLNGSYPEKPDATDTMDGSIGVDTAAVAKNYDGFKPKDFEQETIVDTSGGAAPAVVKIYYDRNTYTVTWKNDNGDVLETDENVMYDATPSYDGDPPTKDPTEGKTYTFKEWVPDQEGPVTDTVKRNITYTASFTETTRQYTVKWLDDDGTTVLDTQTVDYGAQIPSYNGTTNPPEKADTAEYSYEFKEWEPDAAVGDTVTRDITYTAIYTETKRTYPITFKNGDEVLQSSEVEYGETPVYSGKTPTKEGAEGKTYTFDGWDPAISEVTGPQVHTAKFIESTNQYTVRWLDYDAETVLDSKTVEHGGDVPAYEGESPSREADAEYTYEFKEWVPDGEIGDTVTRDITYTASYTHTKRKYTITFKNEDGIPLQSSEVEYGEVPAYTGETPTKAETDKATYTFAGWTPAISAVTGQQDYTATFRAEDKPVDPPKPTIEYFFTQGENSKWEQKDGKGANFRVSRNIADETTHEHFKGIEVDGSAVSKDNYIEEPGSIKLALKSSYIDSLKPGTHTLKAVFDDGSAETTFTVLSASSDNKDNQNADPNKDKNDTSGGDPDRDQNDAAGGDSDKDSSDKASDSSGSNSARTGDDVNIALCILLMLAALAGGTAHCCTSRIRSQRND